MVRGRPAACTHSGHPTMCTTGLSPSDAEHSSRNRPPDGAVSLCRMTLEVSMKECRILFIFVWRLVGGGEGGGPH